MKKGKRQIHWLVPWYESEAKATVFVLRSLLDFHGLRSEMHIKISQYLLRIWHNNDGNSNADRCHCQLRCTSLIATLRPINGSFASLFALPVCLPNGLAIVPRTKVLKFLLIIIHFINPSFTKPFGTHNLYHGRSAGTPRYLKNRCPHELEIF